MKPFGTSLSELTFIKLFLKFQFSGEAKGCTQSKIWMTQTSNHRRLIKTNKAIYKTRLSFTLAFKFFTVALRASTLSLGDTSFQSIAILLRTAALASIFSR